MDVGEIKDKKTKQFLTQKKDKNNREGNDGRMIKKLPCNKTLKTCQPGRDNAEHKLMWPKQGVTQSPRVHTFTQLRQKQVAQSPKPRNHYDSKHIIELCNS